jgi:hypothetical protein
MISANICSILTIIYIIRIIEHNKRIYFSGKLALPILFYNLLAFIITVSPNRM